MSYPRRRRPPPWWYGEDSRGGGFRGRGRGRGRGGSARGGRREDMYGYDEPRGEGPPPTAPPPPSAPAASTSKGTGNFSDNDLQTLSDFFRTVWTNEQTQRDISSKTNQIKAIMGKLSQLLVKTGGGDGVKILGAQTVNGPVGVFEEIVTVTKVGTKFSGGLTAPSASRESKILRLPQVCYLDPHKYIGKPYMTAMVMATDPIKHTQKIWSSMTDNIAAVETDDAKEKALRTGLNKVKQDVGLSGFVKFLERVHDMYNDKTWAVKVLEEKVSKLFLDEGRDVKLIEFVVELTKQNKNGNMKGMFWIGQDVNPESVFDATFLVNIYTKDFTPVKSTGKLISIPLMLSLARRGLFPGELRKALEEYEKSPNTVSISSRAGVKDGKPLIANGMEMAWLDTSMYQITFNADPLQHPYYASESSVDQYIKDRDASYMMADLRQAPRGSMFLNRTIELFGLRYDPSVMLNRATYLDSKEGKKLALPDTKNADPKGTGTE